MHLQCKKCDWQGAPDLSLSGKENQHVKATCPRCDSYIKFVAYSYLDHGDMRKLDQWQREQAEDECDHATGLSLCWDDKPDVLRISLDKMGTDDLAFVYCPNCGEQLIYENEEDYIL